MNALPRAVVRCLCIVFANAAFAQKPEDAIKFREEQWL